MLAEPRAFAAFLAPLRKTEWVVYAKKPFGGPQAVLAYLSRYTHCVTIANRRLISAGETGVTFTWKDYRIEGSDRYKTMTLPTHELIRRFLTHVLPKGFHRIRHYGLFANGNRAANIARARELLAVPYRPKHAETSETAAADQPYVMPQSVPLLWRPHDHHRDLRGRLPAQTPPRGRYSNDQHRHLMMPSPRIHQPSDARHPGWLSASTAPAYCASINRPAVAPPILSGNARPAGSARYPHRSFAAKRLGRALRSNLAQPDAAAKSP